MVFVDFRSARPEALRSRNRSRSCTPPPGLLAALLSFRPFTTSQARPGIVFGAPRFEADAREATEGFPLRWRTRASACLFDVAAELRVDLEGFEAFASPGADRFARRPSPSISRSPSMSALVLAFFRFWMPPRLLVRVVLRPAWFRLARLAPPRGPRGGAIGKLEGDCERFGSRTDTCVKLEVGKFKVVHRCENCDARIGMCCIEDVRKGIKMAEMRSMYTPVFFAAGAGVGMLCSRQ